MRAATFQDGRSIFLDVYVVVRGVNVCILVKRKNAVRRAAVDASPSPPREPKQTKRYFKETNKSTDASLNIFSYN